MSLREPVEPADAALSFLGSCLVYTAAAAVTEAVVLLYLAGACLAIGTALAGYSAYRFRQTAPCQQLREERDP